MQKTEYEKQLIQAKSRLSYATADQPASKASLRSRLGASNRDVLGIINDLRAQGMRICEDDTGYWLSDSCSEYEKTRSRLVGITRGIAGIVIAMDQGYPATAEQVDDFIKF